MSDESKKSPLETGRLGRLASLAKAGLRTAASMAVNSGAGIEQAAERLGELRGLGTKVGQMAGVVEANLDPELRARVGPALAKLRAQAATSPYPAVARIVLEDLGAAPETLFARFEQEPFASASLGQVHRATHHDGTRLAVKIQHPGIHEAFRGDLENVAMLGRTASAFFMPEQQGRSFFDGVRAGFLDELDYTREAHNLDTFEKLLSADPDLETPHVVRDRSSARVLSTTFLRGDSVELARHFDEATRRRQAAAIRRMILSALADHGTLYADAHAGNFLFRDDGTVGVLDFGSVFFFDEAQRASFAALRDASVAGDRQAFGRAIERAYQTGSPEVSDVIAEVQWLGFGGLARGDAGSDERVRTIVHTAGQLKRKLIGKRFSLPPFFPFLVRTLVATNALMAALRAPESGPVGRLTPER